MGVITNWGQAIFTALTNALNLLLEFIPKLVGFLVILLVGWIIASLVSKAVTFLLRKVGFDRLGQRIGLSRFEQNMGVHMDAAGILGKVVYWFLFLIFLVPAADALGVPSISAILNELVAYIPNVFVAILVLFLGALAASVVASLVRGATASANMGNPNLYANIARYAIIGFAAIIALEQLKIAPDLMNILFTAVVGAAAIAFGLAFGLGGRDTARRLLDRTENTVSNAADQVQAQQAMNQAQNPVPPQAAPMNASATATQTDRMNRPTVR
ncbi:MAG TPA: mechanosensitive ion channel [Ktedonobacteraceae bacterium]|nr:mechanosensitive ion channel [Ktedonobacteraceae bacterium]